MRPPVFPAPFRKVLAAPTHEEANRISREIGKGLTSMEPSDDLGRHRNQPFRFPSFTTVFKLFRPGSFGCPPMARVADRVVPVDFR